MSGDSRLDSPSHAVYSRGMEHTLPSLSEFNINLLCEMLGAVCGGSLLGNQEITFHSSSNGRVTIFDNGGEVNLGFERAPWLETPETDSRVRVGTYRFMQSIALPRPGANRYGATIELAFRIGDALKNGTVRYNTDRSTWEAQ